jgi:hypothetical protein
VDVGIQLLVDPADLVLYALQAESLGESVDSARVESSEAQAG